MGRRFPAQCIKCKKQLRIIQGKSNLTYGGFCKDTARDEGCLSKHCRRHGDRWGSDAGKAGKGEDKRRCGKLNGRFAPDQDYPRTWKNPGVTFEQFLILLDLLHKPERHRDWMKSFPGVDLVVKSALQKMWAIMGKSKFGRPNRFQDRVSLEITHARHAVTIKHFVAISLVVRFLRSPRGLVAELLTKSKGKFIQNALDAKQGTPYIQSGVSQEWLAENAFAVAASVVAARPFKDLNALEDVIAERCAHQGIHEHFAARQVACDLTRVKGFVGDLDRQGLPRFCRFGPGGQNGHQLSVRFGH